MSDDTVEIDGSKLDGEQATEFEVTEDGKLKETDDESVDFEENLTFDG